LKIQNHPLSNVLLNEFPNPDHSYIFAMIFFGGRPLTCLSDYETILLGEPAFV